MLQKCVPWAERISDMRSRAECDLSAVCSAFEIVGLPDAAVKEARDRVRAAIKNCGFTFPGVRITVNLARRPAGGHGVRFAHSGGYSGRRGTAQAGQAGRAYVGSCLCPAPLRPVVGMLPMARPPEGGIKRARRPRPSAAERPLWPAGWRSTRWIAWGSWRPI